MSGAGGSESARKFRRGTRAPWLPGRAWGGLEKATAPGGAVRVAFYTKAALEELPHLTEKLIPCPGASLHEEKI